MVVYSTSTHGDVSIQHTTRDEQAVYLRATRAPHTRTFHDVADRFVDTRRCRTQNRGRFAFVFSSDSSLIVIRIGPARDAQPMQITRLR
jgi:hypothetical protein